MNETTISSAAASMIQTLDDIERVAKIIADAKMFGITSAAQASTLMLICQAEGLNPVAALRRYHLIEGRPSMRADAMQGEFEAAGGGIIWHVRTDDTVAATLFSRRQSIDENARERAVNRFMLLWKLNCEANEAKQSALMADIAKLSHDGEDTIIRTLADATAKGLTQGKDGMKTNWSRSPKAMLTARVVTEGVRLLNPGLIAGIVSDDEAHEIADHERSTRTQMLNAPEPQDRAAIEAIIAQHLEEAKTANTTRKSQLLGLASELRAKLADMDVEAQPKAIELQPAREATQPAATTTETPTITTPEAKPTETIVEPPAKKKRAPAVARPDPVPGEVVETPATPWQEVVCHKGKEGGIVNGKTLGTLFIGNTSEKNVASIMDFLEKQCDNTPADRALWIAAQQAHAAWKAETATPVPAKAPESKPVAKQESAATKPTLEPAPASEHPAASNVTDPTQWKDYVLTSKSAIYNGKKLGDFTMAEIQTMHDDLLPRIDWTRATISQKTLKVMVSAALNLPVTANEPEEPEHTAQLRSAITESKIPVADLLSECKKVRLLADTHTKLEDITEVEAHKLLSDWATVADLCQNVLPM